MRRSTTNCNHHRCGEECEKCSSTVLPNDYLHPIVKALILMTKVALWKAGGCCIWIRRGGVLAGHMRRAIREGESGAPANQAADWLAGFQVCVPSEALS